MIAWRPGSRLRHGSLRGIAAVASGLALLLALGVGLLVWRALNAIAGERQLHHQVVAERVFDEIERKLTALVEREEARTFAQYRYFYVPETQVAGSVALFNSPLAEPPTEDFVLGHFQIDPDGSFQTPLRPRNEELARLANGWAPTPRLTQVTEELRLLCVDLGRARAGAGDSDRGSTAARRLDGVACAPVGDQQRLAARPVAANQPVEQLAQTAQNESDVTANKAGNLLSSLNTGSANRAQRSDKQGKSPAQTVYGFQEPGADNTIQQQVGKSYAQELPSVFPRASAGDARSLPGVTVAPPVLAGAAPVAAKRAAVGVPDAVAVDAVQGRDHDQVDVCMTPLHGFAAGRERLLLHREVRIGSALYRQGLALRLPELSAHLAEGVLDQEPLRSHAALRWGDVPDLTTGFAAGQQRFAFDHVFAAPFQALRATVVIRDLPAEGATSRNDVLALLAVLVATAGLGLFALTRMVTVVVHFARRRNDFVSAVTHELKTPLTAIRLHGEMLRDGMVVDEARRQDYYCTITAECERLSRLVNNVLELARLEKGERHLETRIGPLAPLLRELVAVVEPHARACGFTVAVDLGGAALAGGDDQGPSVRYERDALLQVLINLVDNALKFARDATDKRVLVSARIDGDHVRLCVRDHGPGVPERQLTRIFQPFYRGERELTRTTTGTGIGLSLVKGLCEAMGGAVRARNLIAGGFEVEVALRRA